MVHDLRTEPRAGIHTLAADAQDAGASASAVSWAAIFAGAVGALAVTPIMIELGLGLGLSSVSAWDNFGASARTIGVAGGIWLIFVQWMSAGTGGYLAGRLRTRWTGLHTDEVFFRDTAHGFLAWAVATAVGVMLLAMAAGSALNAGGRALGAVASGATQLASGAIGGATASGSSSANAGTPGELSYFVDTLLRPGNPGNQSSGTVAASGSDQANRAEIGRILARDLAQGELSPDDRTYIAQVVASRAGMSQADAEKRVDDTIAQIKNAEATARQAAEQARKASATAAIATALSMVIGAFIACAAAALGGRLRDEF